MQNCNLIQSLFLQSLCLRRATNKIIENHLVSWKISIAFKSTGERRDPLEESFKKKLTTKLITTGYFFDFIYDEFL